MVAIFHDGKSLSKAVNYNEHKVEAGDAKLIAAEGYLKDISALKFHDKLFRLQQLATLNKRVHTNTVHVSLNFDPSEKIPTEHLHAIANAYMEKIGFGTQPFLVYQHMDAGHPHIHIVSTNIKRDGSRISLHNIGRNQSENARKEIEQDFGLVKASGKHKGEQYRIEPIPIQKVPYGKTETKKAISDVVREVVRTYKFTSIAELNAVLRQYNVMADRGSEESFMYGKGGLQYRLLDGNGNKIGVPIKASTVSTRPILKSLEKKFQVNELLRKPQRETIKNTLKSLLNKAGLTKREFENALKANNIQVLFRQNEQGRLYGVTYIDHNTKCVFNGSDLGKEYSANAIAEKLRGNPDNQNMQASSQKEGNNQNDNNKFNGQSSNLLKELISPMPQQSGSSMMPKKRKKKKRNGPQL